MKKVALFDVSALVYAGNAATNPILESKIDFTKGLPVKGVRFALKKILGYAGRGYEVIGVFDSKTDKSKEFPDFKAQRSYNLDVSIQKKMLEDVLSKFGIQTLREDNYEADDLIYSYIWKNYNELEECLIVAHDLDLCGALINPKIRMVGITNDSPTITVQNYQLTAKKGCEILYNTALPFILFLGKPSNNLKPYKDGRLLYGNFCKWATSNGLQYYTLSYESVMKNFLKFAFGEGLITREDVVELVKRMGVVYPRITEEFSIRDSKRDTEFIYTFCRTFGLQEFLSYFKIYNVAGYNKEFDHFLQEWTSRYKSASYAVREGLPADSTFTSEFTTNSVPTVDNFNVGSF